MIRWDQPSYGQEEINAGLRSLESHLGANGPNVSKFERELAKKLNVKYVVAVNNGTSALVASCMVIRHIYGDIKIGVPNFTFIASANSARAIFSNVKLLDVSKNTWNVETQNIQEDIQALISVDVGGLSCDYDELKKLKIPIIADSAESIGATYKNNYVGSQADLHCFSLHRAKIITCGEGGFITTNNKEIYNLLNSYINHGYDEKKKSYEYVHKTLGLNFRISDVQAAIARIQLKKLDQFVKSRREIASLYNSKLENYVTLQNEPKNCKHPYFFYGVLIEGNKKRRNQIVEKMISRGVEVKTWSTVNEQKSYRYDLDLHQSELIGDRVILLPIHNCLSLKEAELVANTLLETI